jgi:hypothetical protein
MNASSQSRIHLSYVLLRECEHLNKIIARIKLATEDLKVILTALSRRTEGETDEDEHSEKKSNTTRQNKTGEMLCYY